jgi:uncharacterized delta-60 repeat protein
MYLMKTSLRHSCSMLAVLLATSFLYAQSAGSLDLGFFPDDTGYGTGVGGSSDPDDSKVVVLPDGKMMVGGFQVGHNLSLTKNVMRLNADGTVDPSFNMPYDPNARCFAVQPDGKVVVGGAGLLKRFNTDGSPDPTFDVGDQLTPIPGSMVYPEATVLDIHVYSDGRIMASGAFSAVAGGGATCGLVRFTPDGLEYAAADLGYVLEAPVHAFVVNEATGQVFATSGDFVLPFSPFSTPVVRFNADLELEAMITGISGYLHRMVLEPNGGIIFSGEASAPGSGYATPYVGRLDPDGTLDTAFAPPSFGTGFLPAFGIAVQPDNKVLAGGMFTMVGGSPREYLVRLEPDGSLDNTFDIGLNDIGKVDTEYARSWITAIAVQPDGRIVTAGQTFYFGNRARRGLARFMPDGGLDNGFNPSLGASDPVRAMVRRPDGRLIVGGDFMAIGDSARGRIAQLLPDGTVDAGFPGGAGVGRAPFADGSVLCLELLPDGSLLVGGSFLRFHGQPVSNLVRLLPDGSLDPDFIADVNSAVMAIAVQPDGRIVIGGNINSVQGVPRRRVARLMPNGALDTDFDPGQGLDPQVSSVRCMQVLPDGRILLGGSFTSYDGVPASNIVLLLPNGAVDPTFNAMPGANGSVENMLLMPDGDILLAGSFTTFNGSTRNQLARLDPDGQLTTWTGYAAPGHPQGMRTLALQPDGRLLVGGHATTAPGGNYQDRGVVRLLPGGGIDDTFDVGDGFGISLPGTPFPRVLALVVDEQGGIITGGDFTSINGTGRNYIARLYQGVSVGVAGMDAEQGLRLYPNPASDMLHVQLPGTGCGRCMLRVQAMDGRMVLQQRIGGLRTQLDVQRLSAGSYTVEVVDEQGGRQVQRFVKQ